MLARPNFYTISTLKLHPLRAAAGSSSGTVPSHQRTAPAAHQVERGSSSPCSPSAGFRQRACSPSWTREGKAMHAWLTPPRWPCPLKNFNQNGPTWHPLPGALLGAPQAQGLTCPGCQRLPSRRTSAGGGGQGPSPGVVGELHRRPEGCCLPRVWKKELKVYCYRNRNAVGQTDGAAGRTASLAEYFGLCCLVPTDPPLELRRQAESTKAHEFTSLHIPGLGKFQRATRN